MFPVWTDDRIGLMIRLWAEGQSAARIARALGEVSRNAVSGKLHRLGLARRAREPRRGAKGTGPGPIVPKRAPGSPRAPETLAARRQGSKGPTDALKGLAPRLEALEAGACHWPLGDPKASDFSFCGRPASCGPYCAVQGGRAYRGGDAQTGQAGGMADAPEALESLAERVACCGPSSLGEAEILRWMLARCEPARPELAQALLGRFGCLARVLGATVGELIPLVGAAAATELVLWREVARRLLVYPLRHRDLLTSFREVEAYLRLTLRGASREQFRVLFLDRSNRLIADELMGEGTVDHAPVYPREVMRRTLELAASALCLVHNHPSATSSPSRADIEMTQRVCDAAKALGLTVHDHFLVAGDQVISFRAQGLM